MFINFNSTYYLYFCFWKTLAEAVVSKILPISSTVKLLKLNIKDEISFKPGQWYVILNYFNMNNFELFLIIQRFLM